MKTEINATPLRSFLNKLENRINIIKKTHIDLDIKEQFMLQKLSTLVNLLYAVDDGVKDFSPSYQVDSNEIDEDLLKDIVIFANQLFVDFELSYDEFIKYYKTIISIYNIIKK